jgi:hypothetical protein
LVKGGVKKDKRIKLKTVKEEDVREASPEV